MDAATGSRRAGNVVPNSLTPRLTDGFYDADQPGSAEAVRLRAMADAADVVSLAALGAGVDRAGVVVADVGCGESASLGTALMARNPSLMYVPIDARPTAVAAHRMLGFDGLVGSATDLPLADGAVDIVHARFVFAWLDVAGRNRTVEEMLRVTRRGARVVIVDYDWGSAAGPDVVVAWKEKLLGLLSAFGFDPFHGQRLAAATRRHLANAGLNGARHSIGETRSTAIEAMRDALGTIGVHTVSLSDQLAALGLEDDADELRDLYAAVVDHGRRHPDTPITFPTIVAATVDRTDAAVATAAVGRRPAARRRADPTSTLPPAGPSGLGVYRLESDDLIDQARRLHAAEYVNHGFCTEDSTDDNGFLIADIDPPEVIARSAYLGVLDVEGQVAGCIRMIRPTSGDMMTLPTLNKLTVGRTPDEGPPSLPFPAGSVVFEASGLAKSSRNRDRAATTRLLLAVVSEARRCGDDYGVMGVAAMTARLLTAIYGERAIRPFDSTAGTISLVGTGIREGGVTLIPCYSEAATFTSDCLWHCRVRPGREFSRLNLPLIELTAAAFASTTPSDLRALA